MWERSKVWIRRYIESGNSTPSSTRHPCLDRYCTASGDQATLCGRNRDVGKRGSEIYVQYYRDAWPYLLNNAVALIAA